MAVLGSSVRGLTEGISKNDNGTLRMGARMPSPTPPKGEVIGDLWYNTADLTLRAWNGSIWQTIGGSEAIMPPARVGPSPVGAYGSGYASFDHTGRAYTSPGNYVILADATNSFINAPSGGAVFVRINNTDQAKFGPVANITYQNGTELTVSDTNTFRSNYGFTMPQLTSMYFRGFGDTNHRIVVPSVAPQFGTNFNVDGPCFVGFNNYVFVTGNNAHWQMAVGANYIQVFGGLGVSNGTNNDVNIDPESITTVSTGSGISMRQRTRGSNDAARRCVVYADGDRMKFWQEGQGDMLHMYIGANYVLTMGLPGGSDVDTIVRIAGSNQLLKHTSSIKAKESVSNLSRTGDYNPVWNMRPVNFKWRNRPQEELERLARLRPGGLSSGFIAEELHEIAPECVTFGADDEPDGLNEAGIIAYLVDGLQYLRKRLEEIEGKKS